MTFDNNNRGGRQHDDRDRGVLFTNARKAREGDPDYTGSLNFGGVDLWISAWSKTSRNGDQYLSLSVRPKAEAAKQPARPVATGPVKFGERRFNRDEGF
jgi:hypothetical protein